MSSRGRRKSLLKQNWRPFYILVNIAVDAVAIMMAGLAAYAIREMVVTVPVMAISRAVTIVLASCVAAVATALLCGLYRSAYRIHFTMQYREAGQAYVYSAIVIVLGMYIALGNGFPPHFSALFLFLIPVFFVAGRTALNAANLSLQKRGYGRHNSMIINFDSKVPISPIGLRCSRSLATAFAHSRVRKVAPDPATRTLVFCRRVLLKYGGSARNQHRRRCHATVWMTSKRRSTSSKSSVCLSLWSDRFRTDLGKSFECAWKRRSSLRSYRMSRRSCCAFRG